MKKIITLIIIILLFLVSSASMTVYSTQTHIINEIDADIIREFFSSKDIVKKINELVQMDYK